MVLCLYAISSNKPTLAALMLTMAMSIKAGAMLLVPSILGCIQYQWGTLKLIKSVFIIVFVQFLVVSPFIYEPAALALGFEGANTNLQPYLDNSKLLGGGSDPKLQRGAYYDLTIYWQFVGRNIYEGPIFASATGKAMLGINVYYFFIRRWCTPNCLYNLAQTFNMGGSKMTFADCRKLIELITIMYLGGVNFVPGGH